MRQKKTSLTGPDSHPWWQNAKKQLASFCWSEKNRLLWKFRFSEGPKVVKIMKGEELGELFILGFRRTCAGSKFLKKCSVWMPYSLRHPVTRMLALIQLVLLQLARVKSLEIRLEWIRIHFMSLLLKKPLLQFEPNIDANWWFWVPRGFPALTGNNSESWIEDFWQCLAHEGCGIFVL